MRRRDRSIWGCLSAPRFANGIGTFVKEGEKLAAVVPPGSLKVVADFPPAAALGRLQARGPSPIGSRVRPERASARGASSRWAMGTPSTSRATSPPPPAPAVMPLAGHDCEGGAGADVCGLAPTSTTATRWQRCCRK
jgi:hypothetical protein